MIAWQLLQDVLIASGVILDTSGSMDAMDQFHQQAYKVLTSGAFARAMDIGAEDPRVVAALHTQRRLPVVRSSYTSEGPDSLLKFMLARRLIEAGVRVVSVSLSDFDTHSDNNNRMRHLGPLFDHGFHASGDRPRVKRHAG